MRYVYIHDKKKNFYYAPRLLSLVEAKEREFIFMKYFGDSPLIVSPELWVLLLKEHKIKYLNLEV